MNPTAPQFSPSGGVGSTYGGFTYGSGGWTPSNKQYTPAPAPAAPPTAPKKQKSVVTSGPAKKVVNDMDTAVKGGYEGIDAYDKARKDHENVLSNLDDRKLSKSERRMIESARGIAQAEIEAQKLANKNYEAGVTKLGITSGRQRYAPEVQGGYQKAAVDQGISKVNELNLKMESSLAEIEQSLLDKNYERAREKYKDYLDFLGERRSAVKDIADMQLKASKASSDAKYAKTAESMKAYNDYKEDGGPLGYEDWAIMKNGVYTEVKNAMTNPQPITQEMADQIGLSSLAGLTDKDVIDSLTQDDAPDWFSRALAKEWMGEDYPKSIFKKKVQLAWDSFRNSPNLKPLKDMAGEFTGSTSGGSSSSGGGDDLY